MHLGKSLTRKRRKMLRLRLELRSKPQNIQPGFVAAKGSVPVKSGKKAKNLKKLRSLSASTKKNKGSSNCNDLE